MLKTKYFYAQDVGYIANGYIRTDVPNPDCPGEGEETTYTWVEAPNMHRVDYPLGGVNQITTPVVATIFYRPFFYFSVDVIPRGIIKEINMYFYPTGVYGSVEVTAKALTYGYWNIVDWMFNDFDQGAALSNPITLNNTESLIKIPLNSLAIDYLRYERTGLALGLKATNESSGVNYADFFGINSGDVYKPYIEIIYEEISPGVSYSGGAGFTF